MTHANAPLTPAGRLRLVLRCESRPIAHVAAEAGVSAPTLYRAIERGEIEAIKIGSRVTIPAHVARKLLRLPEPPVAA